MARPRPNTKAEATKTADKVEVVSFRDALAGVINEWREKGTPVEELQSGLHSETDLIGKEFAAMVEAAKKAKKK